MIELILGGARSGKSRYAEQLAKQADNELDSQVIYIATARAEDDEMAERIKMHQLRRPQQWQLIESPIFLGDVIRQYSNSKQILLIDCLTLWLSNLLCQPESETAQQLFQQQRQYFLDALQHSQAQIILVSNETGLGVVPMGELSRRFVDEAGFLHQEIAQIANKVTLMVAGLAQVLKQPADLIF